MNNGQPQKRAINCEVIEVGDSRTKVLIIDDVFPEIDRVRNRITSEATFNAAQTYYPGMTARAFMPYGKAILGLADRAVRHFYGIPDDYKRQPRRAFYSYTTTPPQDLSPEQREPHFDFPALEAFAALHYIAEGDFGGTGFFRHKPTGIERITPDNLDAFQAARTAHLNEVGPPPPGYINGSTDQFKLIGQADYKPNRLVIYPGSLLHSGLIDPARDLPKDSSVQRLTGNIFFAYNDPSLQNPDAGRTLTF
ncbi:MAG: hypothetical protein EP347_03745 [Alphaproteobacteria bacterium]|nr:MAG: hypothetical protein EP347_03745 [Alphaproteobacteria bacterium]